MTHRCQQINGIFLFQEDVDPEPECTITGCPSHLCDKGIPRAFEPDHPCCAVCNATTANAESGENVRTKTENRGDKAIDGAQGYRLLYLPTRLGSAKALPILCWALPIPLWARFYHFPTSYCVYGEFNSRQRVRSYCIP